MEKARNNPRFGGMRIDAEYLQIAWLLLERVVSNVRAALLF
jgi:hypothetical protein